jgi:6-phosphogluconolactonase (cycloisomerase 2 family)
MRNLRLWAAGAVATALVLVPTTSASASAPETRSVDLRSGAVFVQLNGGSGNSIEAFARSASGALAPVGTFATGGLGGKQTGAPVDALASQSALAAVDGNEELVAVNAGSGTVSALGIRRDRLTLESVVPSGGSFPSSVTTRGSSVYVLNAGGSGAVAGFQLRDGRLVPVRGSVRSLGLSNATVPFFLTAPSQIGLTPDGRTLVVATKANNTLVTFPVHRDGSLGDAIVNASQGPVPFSFVFDARGRLQVTQAGDGRTASYSVSRDSTLVPLGVSAPSGGAALCWNIRIGSYLYGSNAGSGTLTSWKVARDGTTSVLAPVAATTAPGPIDLAASTGGRFLFVLSAVAGQIDAFAPQRDGSLVPVGTTTGLPTINATGGPEGIIAI